MANVVGSTTVGRLLLPVAFLGGEKLEAETPGGYPGKIDPDKDVGA